MLISYHRGQGSIVLRVKILNSSVSTGAGLTGLSSASSGLIISTIADNEASATAYTQAGSTIEAVTTLGTYAAPTATKCRFKEVDATNHKGIYEIQIADARFAVSSAKSMIVSISGVTNLAETDVCVPLTDLDPYDTVRAGLTALPNAAAAASGGLWILGSNNTAAITIGNLTMSALACTTITASGAVAFQSTFAVTTSTSLAALSATTVTFSGAVAFQSTFAVATSTSLAALSATTVTFSGAVAFQSTFIVTGAVTFSSTFATTGTTTFNAFTITNNMLVSGNSTVTGTTTHTGAVSFGSTFGVTGTVTYNAFTVTNATTLSGAVSLGSTLTVTGATTLAALAMTTLTASGAVAFQSTFAVTTSTSLAALSATTITASGTTSLAAVTTSGTVTFNAFTVTNALTVSGATTLTGAVTASNASNNIVGISVAAFAAAGATALRSAIGMSSANLDTQLAAIAAYIDTEVGAIKAKTDQLTFTVALSVDATASVSAANIRSALGMATNDLDTQLDAILAASGGGVFGAGSIQYPVTVVNDLSNPLDGAEVWISTDLAGSNVIAGTLNTDAMGLVTFLLDAGSYYLWVSHSGYNLDNPTAITVS